MSLYEPVYTDALKDVIGNEPVLDEFDIFYEASFYGTSQDDYITGSILTVRNENGKLVFDTGTRGRDFSKFYAESSLPLDSTYGGTAVTKNPSLSFRLRPNYTRVSTTSYRLSQAYDANERYYDSCLPDMGRVLKNAGAEIWSLEENDRVFSPYGNYVSSSVGYLLFDSIEFDRTSEGYEKDPTVINNWTRSFPYEGRYEPNSRLISTDTLLGLNKSSLSAKWGPIKNDVWLPSIGQTYFGFLYGLNVYNLYNPDITVYKNEDIQIDIISKTQKSLTSFVPIIPGYLEPRPSENFRNSLRSRFSHDGGYGEIFLNSAVYSDSGLDKENGYSLLLLSDINLSKKVTNESGLQYVTGSSNTFDLVKFLFGFGDLNNITYARRTYDSSKKTLRYTESFEDVSDATPDDSIGTRGDNYFSVRWNNLSWYSLFYKTFVDLGYTWSVIDASGFNYCPWLVAEKDAISTSALYNGLYIKEGRVGFGTTNGGIVWNPNSSGDNKILVSATNSLRSGFGVGTVPSGSVGMNIPNSRSDTFLEVTSSYPWSFSFDRAVCGNDNEDKLYTSIIDGNGTFVGYYGGWLLDVVSGSNSSEELMRTYDYEVSGAIGDPSNKNYPLPPGKWTIWWSFMSGSGASINNNIPSFAAVSNLNFYSYEFEKSAVIGSNNLPDFSLRTADNRKNLNYFNGINYNKDYGFVGSSPLSEGPLSPVSYFLTGSADIYNSYVAGVSPVIRGWKYGLVNGFPMHTKTIFRRGRYGQFRDMLEQRQYTKFIKVGVSPVDYDAIITENNYNKELSSNLSVQQSYNPMVTDASVDVRFVRAVARVNERGIGAIVSEEVRPEETFSQNLSVAVTSSLPYFDGISRHRSKEDVDSVRRRSFVDTASAVVNASDSQLGL